MVANKRNSKQNSNFDFNFLRALEVFAAVVESRNVTQAAKMLKMTQSGASQHLKKLETTLGIALFDRNLRPLEITNAGLALHRRALAILAEVEGLRADVRRLSAAPLPSLRIAMLASIATTLAPALSVLARQAFSIPEVSLFAGLASDHIGLLRSRKADMAVTSGDLLEVEGLIRLPVMTEKFLLITPKGYGGNVSDINKLARKLPFIGLSRETPVGMLIDQQLSRLRVDLPRSFDGDRASVVLAPVSAGMAFSIMAPTMLIDGLAEGMEVDVHPLPFASFSRSIKLVARKRELDDMPAAFARRSAEVLAQTIATRLPQLSPDHYPVGV